MGACHARTRRFGEPQTTVTATKLSLDRWHQHGRLRALRRLAERTRYLPWSAALLGVLLEELHVDDVFEDVVGVITRLRVRHYPYAVVMALAIRHSWRPDDLARIVRHLGLSRAGATCQASRSPTDSPNRRHARTGCARVSPTARP
jgi:hypothetical protein